MCSDSSQPERNIEVYEIMEDNFEEESTDNESSEEAETTDGDCSVDEESAVVESTDEETSSDVTTDSAINVPYSFIGRGRGRLTARRANRRLPFYVNDRHRRNLPLPSEEDNPSASNGFEWKSGPEDTTGHKDVKQN
eukprot:XP_016663244.1 PREDICTED: uncharacterized protein LOC107884832 [Acyrthosiphon pisum]